MARWTASASALIALGTQAAALAVHSNGDSRAGLKVSTDGSQHEQQLFRPIDWFVEGVTEGVTGGDAYPEDFATTPPPDANKTCHPKCVWTCGNKFCNQKCTPVCEAPKCFTACGKPKIQSCKQICEPAKCAVVCPEGQCSVGNCATCQTVCGKPACRMECGAQQCESKCANPVCSWNCKPDKDCSAQPQCNLNCDHAKVCELNPGPKPSPDPTFAMYLGHEVTWEGLAAVPDDHLKALTPEAPEGAAEMPPMTTTRIMAVAEGEINKGGNVRWSIDPPPEVPPSLPVRPIVVEAETDMSAVADAGVIPAGIATVAANSGGAAGYEVIAQTSQFGDRLGA